MYSSICERAKRSKVDLLWPISDLNSFLCSPNTHIKMLCILWGSTETDPTPDLSVKTHNTKGD